MIKESNIAKEKLGQKFQWREEECHLANLEEEILGEETVISEVLRWRRCSVWLKQKEGDGGRWGRGEERLWLIILFRMMWKTFRGFGQRCSKIWKFWKTKPTTICHTSIQADKQRVLSYSEWSTITNGANR